MRALPFDVKDVYGQSLKLSDDHLSGKTILLVFINQLDNSQTSELLTALSNKQEALSNASINVVAISANSSAAENLAMKTSCQFNGSIPADSTGAIFASYELHKGQGAACRFVVLTPNHLVRA